MAAEQRCCRETLIVHSGWLSVREQRESEERDRKDKRWRGTECDSQFTVRCDAVIWEVAIFSVTHWSTPLYTHTLHALAQGYCRSNGHRLHGDKITGAFLQLITIISMNQLTCRLFSGLTVWSTQTPGNSEDHTFLEIKVTCSV